MEWTARVRAAFEPTGQPEDDVIEELAQHARDADEALRAEGRSEAEARVVVERQLRQWAADAAALRRRARPPAPPPPSSSSGPLLGGLLQDVRYAIRLLGRQPGHAAAAVATMGLGIGATTIIFSVLYGVLLKPLPWAGADRLVRLSETRQGGANRFGAILTNATYRAWQDRPATIEGIGAYSSRPYTFSDGAATERVQVVEVTAALFPLMGARPALGTLFTSRDEQPGGAEVIVISHGFWQERFGGSRSALGRTVRLDGRGYQIVAVMAPGFDFPTRETRAWLPMFVPAVSNGKSHGWTVSIFSAVARLRPGATPRQAAAEGTARARRGEDLGLAGTAVFGSSGVVDIAAAPLLEAETAEVRPALVIFLAAVGLLLATATANVASLQLARAASRRREIAIRSALGAGTGRLARQLLVESALIGVAGGLLGVAIAAALRRALPSLLPADFPRMADIGLDLPVLGVAFGLSLITGLSFGAWPALQARRLALAESLAEDGLAPLGSGLRTRTSRARAFVIVLQVACTCVLLVGAALLARSFQSLLGVDRGFDPHNVLTAAIPMPEASYTGARRAEIATNLLARLRAVPGVRAAAVTVTLPLMPHELLGGFTMPARNGTGTRSVRAAIRQVSPGYFEALGIRLVAGRPFSERDTSASQPVAMVNRAFVKQYLDEPAIGQRLPSGEIVGVVEDVRHRGAVDAVQPEVYVAWPQLKEGLTADEPKVVIRTSTDPKALVETLRSLVRAQDASLALDDVGTMEDRVSTNVARPRLYAVLLGGFAGSALLIAAVGLFGVLSYSVAQRTREIGVRTAIGARPADIVGLVVRQGLAMTAWGAALGLAASLALAGYLKGLLFGVTATDGWSYAVVLGALLAATAVACALPARRAAKTDPLKALRA